jgi:hypothetical protein
VRETPSPNRQKYLSLRPTTSNPNANTKNVTRNNTNNNNITTNNNNNTNLTNLLLSANSISSPQFYLIRDGDGDCDYEKDEISDMDSSSKRSSSDGNFRDRSNTLLLSDEVPVIQETQAAVFRAPILSLKPPTFIINESLDYEPKPNVESSDDDDDDDDEDNIIIIDHQTKIEIQNFLKKIELQKMKKLPPTPKLLNHSDGDDNHDNDDTTDHDCDENDSKMNTNTNNNSSSNNNNINPDEDQNNDTPNDNTLLNKNNAVVDVSVSVRRGISFGQSRQQKEQIKDSTQNYSKEVIERKLLNSAWIKGTVNEEQT